jgi:hypothetical protein
MDKPQHLARQHIELAESILEIAGDDTAEIRNVLRYVARLLGDSELSAQVLKLDEYRRHAVQHPAADASFMLSRMGEAAN